MKYMWSRFYAFESVSREITLSIILRTGVVHNFPLIPATEHGVLLQFCKSRNIKTEGDVPAIDSARARSQRSSALASRAATRTEIQATAGTRREDDDDEDEDSDDEEFEEDAEDFDDEDVSEDESANEEEFGNKKKRTKKAKSSAEDGEEENEGAPSKKKAKKSSDEEDD